MANYVEQIRVGNGDAHQIRDPDAQEKIANMWDVIYPVGSIYMSMNDTDPAYLFGGNWTRIKDTFLLASGDKYAGGSVGGEAEHTLSGDEIPAHNHSVIDADSYTSVGVFWTNFLDTTNGATQTLYTSFSSHTPLITNNAGGSQPHNNMPPYLSVYVWTRTA